MTVLDPVIHFLMTCERRRVRLDDVVDSVEMPRKPVLRVLDKLTREGFLEQVDDSPVTNRRGECGPPRRNPVWKITGDLSGRQSIKPRTNTVRDKLWKLIRAKRYFTKSALVITSGAKPAAVDQYVRLLEKHGYIRRTGRDGRLVTYMLVKNQVERPCGMDGGQS